MDEAYDRVLITFTVWYSILLWSGEGASGARKLDGVGIVRPQGFKLDFGLFNFIGDFERN